MELSSEEPSREAGDQVGSYRLVRPLGEGGMARVWLGESEHGALAAIKLLSPSASAAIRELFAREQKTLLRLQHPNILPILDVGDDSITTAYVEGRDLWQRLRSPMSAGEAVEICCAMASALQAVHDSGVVHCDVKPANILLDQDQTPYLADFGIARFLSDRRGTAREKVRGTPAYMAPEQEQGKIGAAVDQYALAKTFVVMLGGDAKRPLDDNLRAMSEEVNERLGPILRKALSTDPTQRYDSIAAFGRAVRDTKLSDHVATERLAPVKRFTRSPWTAGHSRSQSIGGHIVRADYSLSDLQRAGLIDEAEAARFREQTGYREFGWSLYARQERLGPLEDPAALARSTQTVVFLHGLFATRELWQEVAVRTVLDNALAIALVPDIMGFGESQFGESLPDGILEPKGVVTTMNAWLDLIGLRGTPTAVVGHSYSATSLLCASAEELGSNVYRICITPVFFYFDWRHRQQARLDGTLAKFALSLPGTVRKKLARFRFDREPSLADTPAEVRSSMVDQAMQLGAARVGTLFRSMARARPAPAEELERCIVVTTPNDPLVSIERTEASIAAAGIPRSRWYRLVYGGHFPHLRNDEHPEWGARNIHELVNLIDRALELGRYEQLEKARQMEKSAPTASDPDTEGKESIDPEGDTMLLS